MGVYKDKERNTWYVSCRYKDVADVPRKRFKRGFKTKTRNACYSGIKKKTCNPRQ